MIRESISTRQPCSTAGCRGSPGTVARWTPRPSPSAATRSSAPPSISFRHESADRGATAVLLGASPEVWSTKSLILGTPGLSQPFGVRSGNESRLPVCGIGPEDCSSRDNRHLCSRRPRRGRVCPSARRGRAEAESGSPLGTFVEPRPSSCVVPIRQSADVAAQRGIGEVGVAPKDVRKAVEVLDRDVVEVDPHRPDLRWSDDQQPPSRGCSMR